MAQNNITNSYNIASPAMWVTGNHNKHDYDNSPPLLDEQTTAILVAMGMHRYFTPTHTTQFAPRAVTGSDIIDLRKLALFNGKCKVKPSTERAVANTHPAHKSIAKNKKHSAPATFGRAWKSIALSGAHHLPSGIQKHRQDYRRNMRGFFERERLERWIESENERKAKEAVDDGLVAAMEGFGFGGGGREVGEKVEIDMNGLEMKMAMLDVMKDDDGEIM
ncbi:hypothetical protein HOY82DRAFT_535152 [Tuber indicum]|nr:hypothetical protein HOY82DRAFT_535152 [Tuber indicum]